MNRKNYDEKIVAIFDVIGSYFVDVFYNGHYSLARSNSMHKTAATTTDAYRSIIIAYMRGLTTNERYKQVIIKLHEYYQKKSGYGAIILSDFQDKFLAQFIPPEYYRDFSDVQKDITMREIVVRSVAEFGEHCLSVKVLRKIIDDHKNSKNITALQDWLVDIFLVQREEYYSKFVRQIARKSLPGNINKDIVDKMRNEIIEEKKLRCKLSNDYETAMNMIRGLTTTVLALQKKLTEVGVNTPKIAEIPKMFEQVAEKTIADRVITDKGPPVVDISQMFEPSNNDDDKSSESSDSSESTDENHIDERLVQRELIERKHAPGGGGGIDDDPWGDDS